MAKKKKIFDVTLLREMTVNLQTGHELGGNLNIHTGTCSGDFIITNSEQVILWLSNGTIKNAYDTT